MSYSVLFLWCISPILNINTMSQSNIDNTNTNQVADLHIQLQQLQQTINVLSNSIQHQHAASFTARQQHQPNQSQDTPTMEETEPDDFNEEDAESETQSLAFDHTDPFGVSSVEGILNPSDPELPARYRSIQHLASKVHLPSSIKFSTTGFKKQNYQELKSLRSIFNIIKTGLQITQHPNFQQQDVATIQGYITDILLTLLYQLNNRKKELFILQTTNSEVHQVFRSLGNEGHLDNSDQLRLAQAMAFFNESRKLEQQARFQSYRGRGNFNPNFNRNNNNNSYNNHSFNNNNNGFRGRGRGQFMSLANQINRGSSNRGSGATSEGTTTE